jgi:hypothetical protein
VSLEVILTMGVGCEEERRGEEGSEVDEEQSKNEGRKEKERFVDEMR